MSRSSVLALLLVLCVPAVVSAVGIEAAVGGAYAPLTKQDQELLGSAWGFHFSLGVRASEHFVTDVQGGFLRADEVFSSDASQLYTLSLGAKYFAKALYEKLPDGTTREIHTRVNPFFRTALGAADGEITGQDVNTFLAFVNGVGVRWDPTVTTRDVAIEVDVRAVTGTGSQGEAQTTIGAFASAVLEVDFK